MEYDLVRMGSTLFEDMAVALCSAEFGPGGTSFGVGADGGREWTYDGQLPMPKVAALTDREIWIGGQWDGYTVVQVKHKSFYEGGKKDLEWLLTTIAKEVKDWLGTKEGRAHKPKNLLIITNVRLSPTPTVGGTDRIKKAMHKHATDLKLDGWAVWSAVHVSRLLDNHRNIRKTYIGSVTADDVLAAVLEHYENRNEDATAVITGFVAKELLAHRHVRLTRAGNNSERAHESLADIGIDLPAVDRNSRSSDEADPNKLSVADYVIKGANAPSSPTREGFMTVLIGGPGQGKSTIGQLICQAYRAAILKDHRDNLSAADQGVLDETLIHLGAIGLELPTMHRWPIYIRLASYSETMNNSADSSIQAQITSQINNRGGGLITKSDINVWLAQWPWLVVLDGLDEVPDKHARSRILQKINEFISDAAGKKADISIIATTRPQGYQQDLSSHQPRELELLELDHEQALSYGEKLLFSRNANDLSRAKELYSRLEGASLEPATAKLMGTPLQVSIMASLLEDRVRVPSTRYKLFDEFYETVYRRESSKEGKLGAVVEQYKTEIDSLHNGAGVRLHVESENSEQADVYLSKSELKEIATDYLITVQTYEPDEAHKTASTLVDLTTDRLVLLVEDSTDHWGYEVRSFQEFMASRFITEGSDELVIARLKALSRSSHWRNTWLFAAARVFDDRRHLRLRLSELLGDLDKDTVADSMAKPGAQLACDLIADNFAAGTPGMRRNLLLHCVELLDSPILNRKIVAILDTAAASDAVLRRAIQQKFDECSHVGGRRQNNINNIMVFWSKNYVGALATRARQKIDSVSKSEEADPSGSTTHITLGALIRDVIDLSALTPAGVQMVTALLAEDTALFGKSSITRRLFGIQESHVSSFLAEEFIQSDEACDALDQALEQLSQENVYASNWFVTQIAQTISQGVASWDPTLKLIPGREIIKDAARH